jgi:transcriptional regulator with XRE-family HTH domain
VHAAVESERSQASAARRLGISTSYVSKILRNDQDPAVQESTLVSVGNRLGLSRADWAMPQVFDDTMWAQMALKEELRFVSSMIESGQWKATAAEDGSISFREAEERPPVRSLARVVRELARLLRVTHETSATLSPASRMRAMALEVLEMVENRDPFAIHRAADLAEAVLAEAEELTRDRAPEAVPDQNEE